MAKPQRPVGMDKLSSSDIIPISEALYRCLLLLVLCVHLFVVQINFKFALPSPAPAHLYL